jgi:hypothetical protein
MQALTGGGTAILLDDLEPYPPSAPGVGRSMYE